MVYYHLTNTINAEWITMQFVIDVKLDLEVLIRYIQSYFYKYARIVSRAKASINM